MNCSNGVGKSPRLPRGIAGYLEDRARNPDRYINSPDGLGPSLLFVENVARMLGCNVDHVRRIPRHELPAHKPAQRVIYAREDVEAYVSSRRDTGTGRYVAERAPGKSRATVSPPDAALIVFDPAAFARTLAKDKK